MCLCACHCCSRFCGLLLSTIHGIMAAAGFTSLGYCIGKSNEGMMIAAAVVIVGLLGQYATASGERRTCLLILHIALSFTFAIVLTVLGSLVIADQNTVTAHISAEAVVEFVHQNTKAVGYTVLLAAGAYYVLAFLSWGYRNQINALGEEEAPVADQQELASEFTAAASRHSGHPKTDAARERLATRYGSGSGPRSSASSRNSDDDFYEMQENRSTTSGFSMLSSSDRSLPSMIPPPRAQHAAPSRSQMMNF